MPNATYSSGHKLRKQLDDEQVPRMFSYIYFTYLLHGAESFLRSSLVCS